MALGRSTDRYMGQVLPAGTAVSNGGVPWQDIGPTAELVVSAADPMARCWHCTFSPVFDTTTGKVMAWSLKDIYSKCPDHAHLRRNAPAEP